MIPRDAQVAAVLSLLDQFPVVALLGARQVGKAPEARVMTAQAGAAMHFDLEIPGDETLPLRALATTLEW